MSAKGFGASSSYHGGEASASQVFVRLTGLYSEPEVKQLQSEQKVREMICFYYNSMFDKGKVRPNVTPLQRLYPATITTMYQRIVVKLGTSVLTGGTPHLNRPHMVELARQCKVLYEGGHDIIICSSVRLRPVGNGSAFPMSRHR